VPTPHPHTPPPPPLTLTLWPAWSDVVRSLLVVACVCTCVHVRVVVVVPQLPDIEGESAGRHYMKEFEFQPEQYWQYCGVLFNIAFAVRGAGPRGLVGGVCVRVGCPAVFMF
jgi:hypothetical protein